MQSKKVTQVHHHISDEDLAESISQIIKKWFEIYFDKLKPEQQNEPDWITRKEVGEILSISLVTVDNWTKEGVLTAYRIGTRKRYKRHEVESALTKIDN